MRRAFRRRATQVLVIGALGPIVLSSCSTDDRPSDSEWEPLWLREREALPAADVFLTGGQDLCDQLLGQLRVDLPVLLPTPTEGLDDAVDAWIKHAESIVFECPTDPDELDDRLETLAILAAEVDAGLEADERG